MVTIGPEGVSTLLTAATTGWSQEEPFGTVMLSW